MVESILVGGFLLLGSISDIKTRKISLRLITLFGMIAVLYQIFLMILRIGVGEKIEIYVCLMGAIPGIAVAVLAKISRESIGYGDAYLLIVIGIFLGMKRTVGIIVAALFIISMYSICILLCKKGNLKKELPFIPSLFAAFLLQEILK